MTAILPLPSADPTADPTELICEGLICDDLDMQVQPAKKAAHRAALHSSALKTSTQATTSAVRFSIRFENGRAVGHLRMSRMYRDTGC